MENIPDPIETQKPDTNPELDYQKTKNFVLQNYDKKLNYHTFLNQEKTRNDLTEEKLEAIKFLADYQGALVKILVHTREKNRIELVWAALENRYRSNFGGKGKIAFRAMHDSVIAEAAAYKIFEEIGLKPQLPTSHEDIALAIDLKLEDGSLIQVKGRRNLQEAGIFEASDPGHPGISFETGNIEASVPKSMNRSTSNFYRKIEKYYQEQPNPPKLYMLAIPLDHINSITGEPNPELSDTVRYWFDMHTQKPN